MLLRAMLLIALSVTAVSLSATSFSRRHVLPPETTAVVVVPQTVQPPAVQATAPPATNTVRPVTLRRGDTLVTALTREGLDRRMSHDIAAALVESGADLRRMRPRHALEITW